MANHEAFGRRSKTRTLAVPLLAIALVRVVPAAGGPGPGSEGSAMRERATASNWAQDERAPSEFTLGLDTALPARSRGDRDFAAGPAQAASTETIARLDLLDPRAMVVSMRPQKAAREESTPARSNGSFGHWLKRHWWVPALVGGALLATAGESLYDDDDDDDED